MKKLIVYVSYHHNNTEKIARILANTLQADIKNLKQININNFKEYDIIGFGSGIYFFKLHKNLIRLAKKLPQSNNKKAFIFSTSGITKKTIIKKHKTLKKLLQLKGYEIIGEFNCPGFDNFGLLKIIGGKNIGRPNDEDIRNAEKFAKNLKEKIII